MTAEFHYQDISEFFNGLLQNLHHHRAGAEDSKKIQYWKILLITQTCFEESLGIIEKVHYLVWKRPGDDILRLLIIFLFTHSQGFALPTPTHSNHKCTTSFVWGETITVPGKKRRIVWWTYERLNDCVWEACVVTLFPCLRHSPIILSFCASFHDWWWQPLQFKSLHEALFSIHRWSYQKLLQHFVSIAHQWTFIK